MCSTAGCNDVALVEARRECVTRYRRRRRPPEWSRPADSVADSDSAQHCPHTGEKIDLDRLARGGDVAPSTMHAHLPMLSSHCPGFVCFAEKTHPEAIPYISTCRSAQQIAGRLLKGHVFPPGSGAGSVYHVTIMPCFDKKLEASRRDFAHDRADGGKGGTPVPDVDLVLSTVELLEMMEEDGVDLSALSGAPSPEAGSSIERVMDGGVAALGEASEGYGSGGFLEHIFRYSAQELFGVSVGEEPLVFKSKRNADFQYTELVVDGDVKLRFAKAYGFRNIQSVVKQLRRKVARQLRSWPAPAGA